MPQLSRCKAAVIMLAVAITLSSLVSSSSRLESITSAQFLDIIYELSDCSDIDALVEEHIITNTEAHILRTEYPYASMVQRILPPLYGVYPYPYTLYPNHPALAVGDEGYMDAVVALWILGWEPRVSPYTYEEVLRLCEFLQSATLEPPVHSQFDYDINRTNYRARNALIRAWENIPFKHKDYLELNGWEVSYHTMYGAGRDWNDCSGVTDYNNRTIYLFDCNEGTVYHEVGHALVYMSGYRDICDILYGIEAERGQTFMRGYSLTSGGEFIACAFTEYYVHPDMLRRYCPLTYTYIDRVYFGSKLSVDIDLVHQLKEAPVMPLIKEALLS